MWLKAYFDENPSGQDAGEVKEGTDLRVPAEKTSSKQLAKSGLQQFDFELTEEEYNSANFDLYFWAEPYGRATFKKSGFHDNFAVGRLKVAPNGCHKGGLTKKPPNAMAEDEQIICEFQLVQSIPNFIADEMNTNGKSSDVQKMADLNRLAKEKTLWGTLQKYPFAEGQASDLLGCRTHSNEGDWRDAAQDKIFCGLSAKGGQWDHKPRIRPVWGVRNRLGNRGFVYYYDSWSNIHYGFVARKGAISQENALNGASWAQLIDQLGGKDDPSDVEAIKEGYALGASPSVTIQSVIDIFERNPQWEGRK
jgi:hypothetical protein